ncbi:hypothetical protein L9G16_22385, partial [Shewanella sp. A25]|nr:hypothetical protein [Shewanella shenzhenensis]
DARVSSGDARGIDAVDFQYLRLRATQVASGARSGVIGGAENTAAALESITLGGLSNVAFRDQAGVGGKDSMAGGKQSFAWGNQA